MSPSRRVCWSAISVVWLATATWVAPATAQSSYEDARRALDFAPEPLARSPRQLGMGRLTLVANDAHSRITMWDFAGNPTGILEADSTSTLEIAPGTASAAAVRDLFGLTPVLERQTLGAREVRVQYEAWRRASRETAYGFIGDVGVLRFDRPYTESVEHRSVYTQPRVMPILNGKLPFFLTEQLRYALRGVYEYQSLNERYRTFVVNGQGMYLDQNGDHVDPPDAFTPSEWGIRSVGAGAALSYRVGDPLTLAAGFDHLSNAIEGTNEGVRYSSEQRENRPYETGQFSLIGSIGDALKYGADARLWTSSSEAKWVFTASAGVGAVPVVERGKLYNREESGSSLRSRIQWSAGSFEVGGGFSSGRRTVTIEQPTGSEYRSSFNFFANSLTFRPGADSLALPDSVRSHETEESGWEGSAGAAWTLPGRRGVVGVEYHRRESEIEDTIAGLGPRRVGWDLRAGLELRMNSVLDLRGGYIRRWDERDERTEHNEYLSNSATLGMGVHPVGARWSFESGYAIEWSAADFGDPGEPRGSRQQFDSRIRWVF